MNTQIAEYNETAAALAVLRQKYADYSSVVIATTKDMALAKEARAEVRGYRVALEKLRVELKAPALERTRLIDTEAKRITAELLTIEEPIDAAIKAEEKRKEEEKAAKARAEAQRIADIQRVIAWIRQHVANAAGQRAAEIAEIVQQANGLQIDPDDYGEFLPDALDALTETRQQLAAMLATQQQFEAEQARIKAEQDAEQARIKAEREELARLRKAEEDRKAEEARLQAEREAVAQLLREQAAEARKLEEAQAAQARKAEEAQLQAERDAIARQRAEVAEQQRKLEEAQAAQARKVEEARQAEEDRKAKERIKAEREELARFTKAEKARKAKADPLADLKRAFRDGEADEGVIDEAYQRGYQDGLNAAQRAA